MTAVRNNGGARATFKGYSTRVQVTVFDHSEAPPPYNEKPTTFMVRVLQRHHNKNTSFSNGERVYFGESFERAWEQLERYIVTKQLVPKIWKRYVKSG